MKVINMKVFSLMRNSIFLGGVLLAIVSCASLGSKTVYNADNFSISNPAKILLAKPLLVDCTGSEKETYFLLNDLIAKELNPFGITIDTSSAKFIDFDNVIADQPIEFENVYNANYLLLTKIKRLTAMGQTRDYKIEYKLVTFADNKLMFHSKYSTTFGATVVLIPGITDFPNSNQMMATAIRSGLYEFKKKLSNK